MIDKIVKEYERIYSSISKSKKLIVADIDRIDEEYRKLAQEEKKSLTENLAILNEQLKYYESMLGKNAVAEDTTVEEPNEEEEEKIQDTIFPENNEPEEKPEEKVEEKPAEPKKKGLTKEDIINGLESAGIVSLDTVVEEKKDVVPAADTVEWNPEPVASNTANATELVMDESGWAQFPEEWK